MTYETEGQKAPKFDYNSGKFEFKEIAQLPEDMFAILNRFTAACQKSDRCKQYSEGRGGVDRTGGGGEGGWKRET